MLVKSVEQQAALGLHRVRQQLESSARRRSTGCGAVPCHKWTTLTVVSVLTVDGLSAPWAVNGPMNRRVFDACIETQLVPELGPGC